MVCPENRSWTSQRPTRSQRRGSLVIEAVIASALLATAILALGKLAQSAAALGHQADQRLAATLAGENLLERLRAVPIEAVGERADELADVVAQQTQCDVEVSAKPFSVADREGIHVQVDVSPSPQVRVTLHDWRLKSPAGPAETTADSTEPEKTTEPEEADSADSSESSESGDASPSEGENE